MSLLSVINPAAEKPCENTNCMGNNNHTKRSKWEKYAKC